MFTYKEQTDNVMVEITPSLIKERSIPEQDHYFYMYNVTIHNLSEDDIQLMRRYWIIKNGNGTHREIEGSGVVGCQPMIKAKDSFTYKSYCPLDTETGNLRGKFLIKSKDNESYIKAPLVFFRRN